MTPPVGNRLLCRSTGRRGAKCGRSIRDRRATEPGEYTTATERPRPTAELLPGPHRVLHGRSRRVGKVAFLFPGRARRRSGWARRSPPSLAGSAARARYASLRWRRSFARWRREGPRDAPDPDLERPAGDLCRGLRLRRRLAERGVQPDVVAGHSLGEYAALVGAGVLDFEGGLRLVLQRGELMERSAAPLEGRCCAILGSNAGGGRRHHRASGRRAASSRTPTTTHRVSS